VASALGVRRAAGRSAARVRRDIARSTTAVEVGKALDARAEAGTERRRLGAVAGDVALHALPGGAADGFRRIGTIPGVATFHANAGRRTDGSGRGAVGVRSAC